MTTEHTFTTICNKIDELIEFDHNVCFFQGILVQLCWIYRAKFGDEHLDKMADVARAVNMAIAAEQKIKETDRNSVEYKLFHLAKTGAFAVFKRDVKLGIERCGRELEKEEEFQVERVFRILINEL